MARKQNKKVKNINKRSFPYEAKLIILIAIFLLYAFSIYFNKMGIVGRFSKYMTFGLFGMLGYLMPFVVFFIILFSINKHFEGKKILLVFGVVILLISFMLMYDFYNLDLLKKMDYFSFDGLKKSFNYGNEINSSGLVGDFFAYSIYKIVGKFGMLVLCIATFLISFHLLTETTISSIAIKVREVDQRRRENIEKKRQEKYIEEEVLDSKIVIPEHKNKVKEDTPKFIYDDYFTKKSEAVSKKEEKVKSEPIIVSHFDEEPEKIKKVENPSKEESVEVEQEIKNNISTSVNNGVYNRPKISFLQKPQKNSSSVSNKKDIYENSQKLENILHNFGIKATVVEVTAGPIVNRYELELEPGTKLSKLHSLSDDIALNLAVSHVRIAAVAGKAAVGIEVPNAVKSMVTLREIIESNEFVNNKSVLKFGLGKDIAGKPIIVDLGTMPHLLIAGATGSGKSVCVNTIITSILYNASPDEVKLLMIDPKVVELNVYNGIPHLILPVVTDPKKAAIALGWAVNEMVTRYEKFAETKSKDIDSFNRKNPEEKMPRIVVLIDELSDLMMVASNQVEDSICRLTQMARAAGIHLIVATQRPSVDVITGTIKSNIPSRIAFSVSSYVDSKTILDKSGAEKLLGKGDMLFKGPASNQGKRIQGAFISEKEIENIVNYIKEKNVDVQYNEEVVENKVDIEKTDFEDELFEDAVKLVISQDSASASMLQRKFRIGYNRAGRLIDMMEDLGIIGPPQGSKPRDILMPNYFNNEENDEDTD